MQCRSSPSYEPWTADSAGLETAAPILAAAHADEIHDPRIKNDPWVFLKHCLELYDRHVRDYRCRFIKQERVGGKLTKEEEMWVSYLESPTSVDMSWTRNTGAIARALWIKGRLLSDRGLEQAWIKPSGMIAQLLVPKMLVEVHDPRARIASLHSIDDFGFRRTLEMIMQGSENACPSSDPKLQYMGEGSFQGRPTYVFERRRSYTAPEEPCPDRLLRFHIDQEWLLPTACYSFADDEGEVLIGKYLLFDARFNLGLTERDFDLKILGSR